MLTSKLRLAAGGAFAVAALAAAISLAVPAAPQAAEEGRNEGIPAQAADAKAAPVTGVFYAVVNSNGALVRGSGAAAVTRGKLVGDYVVRFNANVTACAYTATIGQPGRTGVTDPGFITVAGSNGNANSVYVSTYNLNVRSTARSFHLVVACG